MRGPYGIFDLAQNTGWVSAGIDHDTASFAVATIRRWWQVMGKERYAQANRLMMLGKSYERRRHMNAPDVGHTTL